MKRSADTGDQQEQEDRLISWRRRLNDPSLIRRFQNDHAADNIRTDDPEQSADARDGNLNARAESPTFRLLRIPWKLVNASTASPLAKKSTEEEPKSADDKDSNGGSCEDHATRHRYYPPLHHLEIRAQQNQAFCDECLHLGVAEARKGNLSQALKYYQQGLDLIPTHADLLVAKGAALATQQKYSEAVPLLQQALKTEPQHATAGDYLQQVQTALNKSSKTTKAVAAQNDVLMEQSLQQKNKKGGARKEMSGVAVSAAGAEYELLPEEDSGSSDTDDAEGESRRKRRKRRRKDRKKRKRRKRRRREDSEASDSASSSSDDRRRRRHKKSKRKKRRRTAASADDDGSSVSSRNGDSTGTVDSLRLIPHKLKHDEK